MEAHPGLGWAAATAAGRAWLERLPRLVAECAERWGLELGEPFPYAYASLALPGRRGAEEVVLKVQFPDRESEHEAAALALWDGDGAVRLLDHDPERHALLLERLRPGTPLSDESPEAALDVLAGLLPRLWVSAGAPFRTLADEAAWWASYLPERWERGSRPFGRELLDVALEALRDLPGTQGEQVLLHQDLHGANVLRAEREPWLAIDPKPLVGEREFGISPILRSDELGHARDDVRLRLDRLCAELGLDRERARLWAIAQTAAWEVDAADPDEHVEIGQWLLGLGA
ncbi:MAG TPA: aminoglycoside phosphotransferase family protein [Gaiellaceae bacterium]|nr:aminoglycoside phosphotransferase family protein [Gaiellaceae bacterium]